MVCLPAKYSLDPVVIVTAFNWSRLNLCSLISSLELSVIFFPLYRSALLGPLIYIMSLAPQVY